MLSKYFLGVERIKTRWRRSSQTEENRSKYFLGVERIKTEEQRNCLSFS
jgi:hypothetical protein